MGARWSVKTNMRISLLTCITMIVLGENRGRGSGGESSNEPLIDRLRHCFGLGVYMQLFVDLLKVCPHGVDTDMELRGDQLVAVSARQRRQHVFFAGRKLVWI